MHKPAMVDAGAESRYVPSLGEGAAPIHAPPDHDRLSAERASFRLLLLAFVRDYLTRMGASPSYGEIAAHFGCSRTRVKKAVHEAVRRGELLKGAGQRSLCLPSLRDEAMRLLEEQGFVINPGEKLIWPPEARQGVTNPPLLPPPELDYVGPRSDRGSGNGSRRQARAGDRAAEGARADDQEVGKTSSRARR